MVDWLEERGESKTARGLFGFARLGARYLRGAGELHGEAAEPARVAVARRQLGIGLFVSLVVIAAIYLLSSTGTINLTVVGFAQMTGAIIVVVLARLIA